MVLFGSRNRPKGLANTKGFTVQYQERSKSTVGSQTVQLILLACRPTFVYDMSYARSTSCRKATIDIRRQTPPWDRCCLLLSRFEYTLYPILAKHDVVHTLHKSASAAHNVSQRRPRKPRSYEVNRRKFLRTLDT